MRTRVLIIDDDPVNNYICRETIKMVNEDCDMIDFTRPEDGLKYIETSYKENEDNPKTILFLDLNMNMMTGWEFLNEFYKFGSNVTGYFVIYILSSSLDGTDRAQSRQMPLVKDFIVKPLNQDVLKTIFNSK
jgi:response regulator RpfG family c-di-GMP phosphodiesterase